MSWSARLVNAGASSPTIYNASRAVASGLTAYDTVVGSYHAVNGLSRAIDHGDSQGWAEAATGGLLLFGGIASARELAQPKLGGAYGELQAMGGERHHAPAKSISSLNPKMSPAFRMSIGDHALTASSGKVAGSRLWREAQNELVFQGRFRQAAQMDIDNVRGLFKDGRYNQGIQEMVNYIKRVEKGPKQWMLLPKGASQYVKTPLG